MRVVFRADGNPEIGTGHVTRCMAFGEELERLGFEVLFAVSPDTAKTVPALRAKNWRLIEIPGKGEAEQAALLERALAGRIAALIVDHYGLGKPFESAARRFSDQIAVLEDKTNREHDCDLLINSNAGLNESVYRSGLVPDACRILLGARHAPMRGEFAALRADALARRNRAGTAQRVLISFGGSDPANATGLALAALEPLAGRIRIDVAIGSAAPALRDLQNRFRPFAEFHVATTAMAELMRDADLAIGGGGSTAWERAALGLPSILLTIADNQRDIARALHETGAAINLGVSQSVSMDELRHAVERLADDPEERMVMSYAAAKLTDGRGAARLAIALSGNAASKDGTTIRLRRAELNDLDTVLVWQREPGARRYSRNPEPPTAEEHAGWFVAAVDDPDRVFAMVELAGEACGFVRLDARAAGSYEVSLLLSAKHQGRGIGAAALQLARKCVPRAVLDAHILPENTASVAAFTKAGYIPVADGLMRSVPA